MTANLVSGTLVTPKILKTDDGRFLNIKAAPGTETKCKSSMRLKSGESVKLMGYYPWGSYQDFSYFGQMFEDESYVDVFGGS